MNPDRPLPEPTRWRWRQWVYTVGAVFLLQLGLVFYFAQRAQSRPAPRVFNARMLLATHPELEQGLRNAPGLSDPTLFALGSTQGFSGRAWLEFHPLQHQLTNWTEPPRWLALDPEQLGSSLIQAVASNPPPSFHLAGRSTARFAQRDVYVPPEVMPARSELLVESDGANQSLLSSYELPSWPHSDLLTNTIVQVVVNADGHAVSATPLVESGLREADQFAVDLAVHARFAPLTEPAENGLRTNRLNWIRLIFQWHTLPLSATNMAAARALSTP